VPKMVVIVHPHLHLPPAARGALFEKTAPLDPPQKLLFNFVVLRSFLAIPFFRQPLDSNLYT
jgi:hypothetical protein